MARNIVMSSTFSKFRLDVPTDSQAMVNDSDMSSTLFCDLAQPGSSPMSAPSGSQKLYGISYQTLTSGFLQLAFLGLCKLKRRKKAGN